MDVYKPLISDGNFATNLAKAWTEDSFSETVRQMDLHAGGEYKYGLSTKQDQAYIALRAGYTMDRDGELSSPTFGVGVKYNLFQVDVAYLTANDTPMQDNTRFSLNLSF
jgi:hypothetical protein